MSVGLNVVTMEIVVLIIQFFTVNANIPSFRESIRILPDFIAPKKNGDIISTFVGIETSLDLKNYDISEAKLKIEFKQTISNISMTFLDTNIINILTESNSSCTFLAEVVHVSNQFVEVYSKHLTIYVTYLLVEWLACKKSENLVLFANTLRIKEQTDADLTEAVTLKNVSLEIALAVKEYTDLCDFDGHCDWYLINLDIMTENNATSKRCHECLPEEIPNRESKQSGRYGALWIDTDREPLQKGMLQSRVLVDTYPLCELGFLIANGNEGTMNVVIASQDINRTLLYVYGVAHNRYWRFDSVKIGKITTPFRILLSMKLSRHLSYVAVDDIYLHRCFERNESTSVTCGADDFQCNTSVCIPRTSLCDVILDCLYGEDEAVDMCENSPKFARCTFELDNCDWVVEPPSPCSWTRWEARNLTSWWNLYHTGHLMYIEKSCKNASCLLSPLIHSMQVGDSSDTFMVKFFYLRDDASDIRLEIIERGKRQLLWKTTRHVGDPGWQKISIYVTNVTGWFRMRICGRAYGYLGIDDISITPWRSGANPPQNRYEDGREEINRMVKLVLPTLTTVVFAICVITAGVLIKQRRLEQKRQRMKRRAAQRFNSVYENTCEENECFFPPELSRSLNMAFRNKIERPDRGADKAVHVPFNKLRISSLLGRGAFGEVYMGYLAGIPRRKTDLPVAVKKLPTFCTDETKTDFFLEILILSNFNHPHIVQFLGISMDGGSMYMLLEFMTKGDLRTYLIKGRPAKHINTKSFIERKHLLKFALDIASGCHYLELNGFIHRDLAARNCLLTEGDAGIVAKIGDFGLARDILRSNYYKKSGRAMVPVKWMPPEAFQDGIFTSKTDVWYSLMLRCWASNLDSRPLFEEILKLIQEELLLMASDKDKYLPSESSRTNEETVMPTSLEHISERIESHSLVDLHQKSEESDNASSRCTETSFCTTK